MPLRLNVTKKLGTRSERVKCVDLHPTEPWVLAALYNGILQIHNYDTGNLVKSFEVTDQPIRYAKFVARKQWIVCGSDDMMVRVFNVNTMEKVREFECHQDYVRSLEVHPIHPYLLTSSDDMQIKLWDWDKGWANTQCFDGHSHYVMMVKFNPKDTNTFASASLDRTVKIWSLGSPLPNFSLEGHMSGVNCVDYYHAGDKPYVISGSDDFGIKVWDYQTKACVHTLKQHTNNVSSVVFHPNLPIILSGSEDGTVRIWHSTTYRLESTLNYGLERCWTLAVSTGSNKVAIGYDEGVIVLLLGREMPVVSMDKGGKVLLGTNKDIQSGALRNITNNSDGEIIESFQTKTAGPTEMHLQHLEHNLNGRFVVSLGDGEYIIYTSQALRNKSFGQALDFGWSTQSANDYAVRDHNNKVRVFFDFKETAILPTNYSVEGLFGGWFIAAVANDGFSFYTWHAPNREIVKIEGLQPKGIYWSEDGTRVAVACEDSYYVLSVDLQQLNEALAQGGAGATEATQACFEYLDEIAETCKTGCWVGGDCFLYTNAAGRLNYYVGGEVITLAHLDREMVLLGYLSKENQVFLMDKARNVIGYQLLEPVLQYQTAVVRKDFQAANALLAQIPRSHHLKIARFLEGQGYKEAALAVSPDPDHKFELALGLEKFDVALKLMREEIVPVGAKGAGVVAADVASKWKQLGDLALSHGNVDLAAECSENANDLASLLLIYSSTGNVEGLARLAENAHRSGLSNVAFIANFLLGDAKACVEVLQECGRSPEAAFMALNYYPSSVAPVLTAWKEELAKSTGAYARRVGTALVDPNEKPEKFNGFLEALQKEHLNECKHIPAPVINGTAAASSSPRQQQQTPIKPTPTPAQPQQTPQASSPRASTASSASTATSASIPVPSTNAPPMASPSAGNAKPAPSTTSGAQPQPTPASPAVAVSPTSRVVDTTSNDFVEAKVSEVINSVLASSAPRAAAASPASAPQATSPQKKKEEEAAEDELDDDELAELAEGGENEEGEEGADDDDDLALEEEWE